MTQFYYIGTFGGFDIEMTVGGISNDTFFTWERNYILLSLIGDVADGNPYISFLYNDKDYNPINVETEAYIFPISGVIQIDITDILRSVGSSLNGDISISIALEGTSSIVSYDFKTVYGKFYSDLDRQLFPKRIPAIKKVNSPFYIPLEYATFIYFYMGREQTAGSLERLTEVNLSANRYLSTNVIDIVDFIDSRNVVLYNPTNDCSREFVNLTWRGYHGLRKSWVFQVVKRSTKGSVSVNLQTDDSGYRQLRDRVDSIVLRHERADYLTQVYLSDICQSNEVVLFDYASGLTHDVEVTTNALDIQIEGNPVDVEIGIKFAHYDTY